MNQQDFRFFLPIRVRWAEVDMQKIVFNAHYLMYFDTAVAGYWRALALPYEEAMHLLGGDLYVRKATLEFSASARMDDQLEVALRCGRIGNSSMHFQGAIFRAGDLLVTCDLVYVFAQPATQSSRPVPTPLREILTDYEAGADVVRIQTGTWDELGLHASRIRTEVFVSEQRIPVEMEWDEADAVALHAVAFNGLGQAVATGRLLRPDAGTSRIGRMAVHRVLRASGLGGRVLEALLTAAARRGDATVLLHAQRSAESFYAARGFHARGEPFDEAGIPHIEMTTSLQGRPGSGL